MVEKEIEKVPYRPMWITSHWVIMASLLLNVFLFFQLQRAKDVQEDLIKDHLDTIKKQNKMIEDLSKPRKKEDWP